MNLITVFFCVAVAAAVVVVYCTSTIHNQFHRQFSKSVADSREKHIYIECKIKMNKKKQNKTKPFHDFTRTVNKNSHSKRI